MIEVQGLTVRFRRHTALDAVSFQVPAGGSLALWGENGAGKTTAIRAVLGLLPYRGDIRVHGHDLRRHGRRARAAIGYVPQQLALYDELSALGYLRFMAGLRHVPADQAAGLLARVGLDDHAAKAVGALSGGMRQRLALAAALLGDPPILVLDEPTANLDAAARADFLRLLGDLAPTGKTFLFTSHRAEEVAALAGRVLVLAGGRVQAECAAAELAQALGLHATLRLMVAEASVDAALAALAAAGYPARRNGLGVLVQVPPGERAVPVRVLLERGVAVDDLALEEGGWTAE